MKEISFIRQNIAKWEGLEQAVASTDTQDEGCHDDPYTEITTDLSFSRSHYSRLHITTCLNNLASTLHNVLYKNKKEKRSRILLFWKEELPLLMYETRHEKYMEINFSSFSLEVMLRIISGIFLLKNDFQGNKQMVGAAHYKQIDLTLN